MVIIYVVGYVWRLRSYGRNYQDVSMTREMMGKTKLAIESSACNWDMLFVVKIVGGTLDWRCSIGGGERLCANHRVRVYLRCPAHFSPLAAALLRTPFLSGAKVVHLSQGKP